MRFCERSKDGKLGATEVVRLQSPPASPALMMPSLQPDEVVEGAVPVPRCCPTVSIHALNYCTNLQSNHYKARLLCTSRHRHVTRHLQRATLFRCIEIPPSRPWDRLRQIKLKRVPAYASNAGAREPQQRLDPQDCANTINRRLDRLSARLRVS
jgi:hypothetical protein